MTIAIGEDVIDVLVHGPNRYFDNYRADPIPGVRDVYPFGYCARISWTPLPGERRQQADRSAQTEQFRGLLVPFLARSLDRHTLPAFRAMNEALKQGAEHTVAPRRG